MKVRATMKGYYKHRRVKEGEVFSLVPIQYSKDGKRAELSIDEQFSSRWMEVVKDTDESAPKLPTLDVDMDAEYGEPEEVI